MTRVWNWAPECLYMPPTGLFAQTAGKREKQECVCAQHKMSFVKSFKMKNSSRKRSDRQAKRKERERGKFFDGQDIWETQHLLWLDRCCYTGGKKGSWEKDLNQWELNVTTRKRSSLFVFLFAFRLLSENKLMWAISLSKTSSTSYYFPTENNKTKFVSLHFLATLLAFNWAYQLSCSSRSSGDSFGTSRQSYHVVSPPFTVAIFTQTIRTSFGSELTVYTTTLVSSSSIIIIRRLWSVSRPAEMLSQTWTSSSFASPLSQLSHLLFFEPPVFF